MGFSDPSANLCDSTANFLAGSKCTNNFDDVSKFFGRLEASECLRDHNNFVDDLRGDNVVVLRGSQ